MKGLGLLVVSSVGSISFGIASLTVSAADGENDCQEDGDITMPTWLFVYGIFLLVSMGIAWLLYVAWNEETPTRCFRAFCWQLLLSWIALNLLWFVCGIITVVHHWDCVTDQADLGIMTMVDLVVQVISFISPMWGLTLISSHPL